MEQGWLDERTLNEAIDFQQAGQEAPPPPHAKDKPATT